MPLHLIKLCVGCDSIAELEDWIEENRAHHRRLGRDYEQAHTTRMVPKRADALVNGGSLYWVIKGQVACRQQILAVRPFTDAGGVGRCHLVLEPSVIAVEPRPYRPFQGWRYLEVKHAPRTGRTWASLGGRHLPDRRRSAGAQPLKSAEGLAKQLEIGFRRSLWNPGLTFARSTQCTLLTFLSYLEPRAADSHWLHEFS